MIIILKISIFRKKYFVTYDNLLCASQDNHIEVFKATENHINHEIISHELVIIQCPLQYK